MVHNDSRNVNFVTDGKVTSMEILQKVIVKVFQTNEKLNNYSKGKHWVNIYKLQRSK